MGQFIHIDSFKVRERKLIITNSQSESFFEDYYLPHGIYISDKTYKLLFKKAKNSPLLLLAPKKIGSNLGLSQLYPYFESQSSILLNKKNYRIKFWQVVNDFDKHLCQLLVAKYHHRPAPMRGMILACSIPDMGHDIIACAFLDKMTHTLALNNRSCFLNIDNEMIETMTRGEIVNDFGISWASRFVVGNNYRGSGIGKLLAKALIELAAKYYVPISNFVEVYATVSNTLYEKYKGDKGRVNNFLTNAGFNINRDYKTSSKFSFEFDENGFNVTKRGKRLYYYADVRHKQNRLFVPLNKNAYQWFLKHNKTWEVRNCKGAFTENNVYIGKSVELRRGYADKQSSLWGKVVDIRRFFSVQQLFSKIDYKLIIPIVNSKTAAIEYSKRFLKIEEDGKADIIAIKIKL